VVTLHGRVMQTRNVPTGTGIGYGHTAIAQYPMRLAAVAVGYADGFLRSSKGAAWFGDTRLPIVGRVSMDSIILDITDLAEPLPPDALVELIGSHHDIDAAASAAGTIGYELLTNLGPRYARRIIGA
jgi:alanine racemase